MSEDANLKIRHYNSYTQSARFRKRPPQGESAGLKTRHYSRELRLGFCGAVIFAGAAGEIAGALDFAVDGHGVVDGFAVCAGTRLFFLGVGHVRG